jgi:hypothetical protein
MTKEQEHILDKLSEVVFAESLLRNSEAMDATITFSIRGGRNDSHGRSN